MISSGHRKAQDPATRCRRASIRCSHTNPGIPQFFQPWRSPARGKNHWQQSLSSSCRSTRAADAGTPSSV